MGRLITALLVLMISVAAFAVDDWPMWRALIIQHVSDTTNYVNNTNLFDEMVYMSGKGRWEDFSSTGMWLVTWGDSSTTGRSKLKWSSAKP